MSPLDPLKSFPHAGHAPHLDNGRDEFLHEVVLQEIGPVVVNKIDDEPLDVGPVVILICHDHDLAVAQILHVVRLFVLLAVVQTDDFAQIGDLRVVHHLKRA